MDFPTLTLDSLLGELVELTSDWMDDRAATVLALIGTVLPKFREGGRKPDVEDLASAMRANPMFLDVCRLFLGVSQETAAHEISARLPAPRSWTGLRRLAAEDPASLAQALVRLGLPDVIYAELHKSWSAEDVLSDRYKLLRGRATAGQARGRSLENKVEQILKEVVPY